MGKHNRHVRAALLSVPHVAAPAHVLQGLLLVLLLVLALDHSRSTWSACLPVVAHCGSVPS